jgi:DNA-binding GntR family transcriptional regulator
MPSMLKLKVQPDKPEEPGVLLYQNIGKELVHQLATGQYKQGDKLPSILALAKQHSVSHQPVRQAIALLKSMGVLEPVNRSRAVHAQ